MLPGKFYIEEVSTIDGYKLLENNDLYNNTQNRMKSQGEFGDGGKKLGVCGCPCKNQT